MTALVGSATLPPDALARAARGDLDAYGDVVRTHAAEVFDLAARVVRNRHWALDIACSTFVDGWADLRESGADVDPAEVRHAFLGRAARGAATGSSRPADCPPDDALAAVEARLDPSALRVRADVAEAAWAAAASLEPGEYAVVDLWVRRRLNSRQIAAATGGRARRIRRKGPALLQRVDGTAVAVAIARARDCDEAATAVDALPAHAPLDKVRAAVDAHLERGCIRCAVVRSDLRAPAETLAALAPLPWPAGWDADALWTEVHSRITAPPPSRRLGLPSGRMRWAAAAAAVAVVLAGVGAQSLRNSGPDAGRLSDPDGVRSSTHEVGVASGQRRITVVWDPHPTATGFSVAWTEGRAKLPDTVVDVPGGARSTTSPALAAGRWWFTLRTRGDDGRWTSTETLGPFVVVPARPPVESTTSSTTSTTAATTSTARPSTTRPAVTTTTRPPVTTTSTAPPAPPTTRRSTTTTTQPPPTTERPTTSTTVDAEPID